VLLINGDGELTGSGDDATADGLTIADGPVTGGWPCKGNEFTPGDELATGPGPAGWVVVDDLLRPSAGTNATTATTTAAALTAPMERCRRRRRAPAATRSNRSGTSAPAGSIDCIARRTLSSSGIIVLPP
jgi:hypothetical protein